jgi:Na+-translocating ferredoxin:NAD+ oxidoreductase RNF subunit RnfB
MQEIEKVMELIEGTDCSACGAPDCRTFAEDVVRGDANLKDCLFVGAHKRKTG